MEKLYIGNGAVARGLYEAGVRVASSYPGTPSTEITELAAEYPEIYCEWAPNEKVAYEVALGASIAGARSFCAMKHVGLNVAADPMMTSSYTGVNGGMVCAVADDPGMHSSQNEQDSRNYAVFAKLPMLEPSDSADCRDFTVLAYELSERFDAPVFLRLSTRVSHSQSALSENPRNQKELREYKKDVGKYVMVPAAARKRRLTVEARLKSLIEYAETAEINRAEYGGEKIRGMRVGVITSGIAYQYAREALGSAVSYFKLGMVWPLPVNSLKAFAEKMDAIYVIEELDDIIEIHCKKHGIQVEGKSLFPFWGEYSPELIRKVILGAQPAAAQAAEAPPRPPVLCPGCPHRGLFHAFSKLGLYVSGDIGCYTLGSSPPLSAMDTTVCMGASVSGLHGFNKARDSVGSESKSVAVIGDSTFIHSGVTGLINIVYNNSNSTVVIADNSTTGMTGHQHNPTTGFNISGDPAAAVDLEALCRAVGVRRVSVVDPLDSRELERVLKEELAAEEPSVIIARRPCALLKNVARGRPFAVSEDKCRKCGLCLKLSCPSISMKRGGSGRAAIDPALCVGCGMCAGVCPFKAIGSGGEGDGGNGVG